MSSLALLPPSTPIHKERERRRLRKELPSEKGQSIWSIRPVGIRSRTVKVQRGKEDQRRPWMYLLCQHHHVLKPTPPLPTHSLVLTTPSVPVMTASGSTMTMPATGSLEKWGVRRQKRTSSTPSEVIGGLFSYYFFSSHFLIYLSFHQPNPNPKTPSTILLVQEPPCRLLHVNYQRHRPIPQHRTALPPHETPNTRKRIGLFELPVALAVQALLPCVQDQTGGIPSVTINKREAPVQVGRANGMKIEILKIPILGREDLL